VDELAKRFADLAEHYGPMVSNAAVEAARIEGYSILVGSLMWLAVAVMFAILAWFIWARRPVKDTRDSLYKDDNMARDLMSVLAAGAGIVAGACVLAAVWSLIDPWTWAAINHPELYLAKLAFKM
jgi:hypothetical protein